MTSASRQKTYVLTCSMTGSTVVWLHQFCRYKKTFGVVYDIITFHIWRIVFRYNAHVIGFPEGGPQANVGTLQTSSAIAPPAGALFFITSPTLSPVLGALQHANGYNLHFSELGESYIEHAT